MVTYTTTTSSGTFTGTDIDFSHAYPNEVRMRNNDEPPDCPPRTFTASGTGTFNVSARMGEVLGHEWNDFVKTNPKIINWRKEMEEETDGKRK